MKLSVKDDRRGRLEQERFYKIGGQGPGRPLFFEQTDAASVGTDARILDDVRQYMSDTAGTDQTKTKVRANVKGDNGKIDRALDILDGDPREPTYAKAQGNRSPVYSWAEKDAPAAGMEL